MKNVNFTKYFSGKTLIIIMLFAFAVAATPAQAQNFQVSGGGGAYISIGDAVNAVPEGGTITLLHNATSNFGMVLSVNKTYTLDLDGYTMTSDEGVGIYAGAVTIKNGIVSTTNPNGCFCTKQRHGCYH